MWFPFSQKIFSNLLCIKRVKRFVSEQNSDFFVYFKKQQPFDFLPWLKFFIFIFIFDNRVTKGSGMEEFYFIEEYLNI